MLNMFMPIPCVFLNRQIGRPQIVFVNISSNITFNMSKKSNNIFADKLDTLSTREQKLR